MWWNQHMTGLGWAGLLVGGLMMLLFWGSLIVLIFFAIRAFTGTGNTSSGTNTQRSQAGTEDSALDILKKRYARGEISQAEYNEMRQQLST